MTAILGVNFWDELFVYFGSLQLKYFHLLKNEFKYARGEKSRVASRFG